VADVIGFADHHPYRIADLVRVQSKLRETSAAAVLTTEKDAVRLLPLRPLAMPIAAVPLRVEIGRAGAFEAWLLNRLRERRQ
jgi:tetraacyldisaccharide 4'-kinase